MSTLAFRWARLHDLTAPQWHAVLAARDARKAATSAIDAFRSFPRGPLARVTPASLDWFGPPHRAGEGARYAFPQELPRVAILTAGAGMDEQPVKALLGIGCKGVVLAGMGQGNAMTHSGRAQTFAFLQPVHGDRRIQAIG